MTKKEWWKIRTTISPKFLCPSRLGGMQGPPMSRGQEAIPCNMFEGMENLGELPSFPLQVNRRTGAVEANNPQITGSNKSTYNNWRHTHMQPLAPYKSRSPTEAHGPPQSESPGWNARSSRASKSSNRDPKDHPPTKISSPILLTYSINLFPAN